VGWLFVVSLALVMILLGPLALFDPWFVSLEQARNDVPARLEESQAEVDRVTGGILCDLVLRCDDFNEAIGGQRLLTDAERSHMRDVGNLVRILIVVLGASLVVLIATAVALRRERRRIGRLALGAGLVVGSVAVLIGLAFAVAFDQAFLAFHEVFFPQGNFLFGPDSNLLRLFPEGFWFEASLAAGTLIVLSALIATTVGWRLSRPGH
jgi:integral membrane protein (TIGR01906 family)